MAMTTAKRNRRARPPASITGIRDGDAEIEKTAMLGLLLRQEHFGIVVFGQLFFRPSIARPYALKNIIERRLSWVDSLTTEGS